MKEKWLVIVVFVLFCSTVVGQGVHPPVGQNDEQVTLLNPFNLQESVVNVSQVSQVVVLRSASLRTISVPTVNNAGPNYIFRNSVIRCPIMLTCASSSCLNPE